MSDEKQPGAEAQDDPANESQMGDTVPSADEQPVEDVAPESSELTNAVEGDATVEAGAADVPQAGDSELASDPVPAVTPQVSHSLENILEALLLASESPLSLDQIQRLLGDDFGLDRKALRESLHALGERYADAACELREVAGGWRLQVRAEYGDWVARLWQEKTPRFSRALLETLALIVYRQPITRGEIEDVRGVAVSSNILRTLLERGWIRELGHKEVPGRPMLYGSTSQLLDDLNLKSLSDLPELPEIKDLDQLEAALARLGVQLPEATSGEAGDPADSADAQSSEDASVETGDEPPPETTLH